MVYEASPFAVVRVVRFWLGMELVPFTKAPGWRLFVPVRFHVYVAPATLPVNITGVEGRLEQTVCPSGLFETEGRG